MGGSLKESGLDILAGAGQFATTGRGRRILDRTFGEEGGRTTRRAFQFADPGGAAAGTLLERRGRERLRGRFAQQRERPQPLPAQPQPARTPQRVQTSALLAAAQRRSRLGVGGTRRTSPLGQRGDRAPLLRRTLGE